MAPCLALRNVHFLPNLFRGGYGSSHIHIHIYVCMTVSRCFLCTKIVGAQEVPTRKIRNEIGHETAKKVFSIDLYDGFEALDLNINIFISKYTRELKKCQKTAPNFLYIFAHMQSPISATVLCTGRRMEAGAEQS